MKKRTIGFDFLLSKDFKFGFTIIMSCIAFGLFILNCDTPHMICLFAVLASTVADLILMDYNGLAYYLFQKKFFYVGMLFFAIAHILYAVCFVQKSGVDVILCIRNMPVLVAYVVSVFVGEYLAKDKSDVFKLAVLAYLLCMFFNAMVIFTCAELYGGKYIAAAVGITAFIISDFFILVRETVSNTPFVKKMVWVFYPIGQLLIIFSI